MTLSGGRSGPVTWPANLPIANPAPITQKLTYMMLPPGWPKSASASVSGSCVGYPPWVRNVIPSIPISTSQ